MFSLSSTTSAKPSLPANFPAKLSSLSSISISIILPSSSSSSSLSNRRKSHSAKTLIIRNIDAAQPYDYESKLAAINNKNSNTSNSFSSSSSSSSSNEKLKIAIVGFGNYGQFLAKTFVSQGHTVLAYSRSDYSKTASNLGVSFFNDPHDLCEEHPEVILLCTSILSTELMLNSLPLQRLKRSTLFVDVLSVKEFPRNLFLQTLPSHFDVLCTHPMFGPESGKNGWGGLPFVFDKVRIGKAESRIRRCEIFLDVFRNEGCRVEEMTCAEHDKYAAGSQFITHFLGRVLENVNLEDTPINTKGYESLLSLVDNTSKDSFELFYGLFLYNQNAMEQLERLDWAFELVKQQLFGHLHGLLRKQLFGSNEIDERSEKAKELKLLSDNGSATTRRENGSATTPRENGSAMTPRENGSATTSRENDSATTARENDSAMTSRENATSEIN